jgi:hypothetical protein
MRRPSVRPGTAPAGRRLTVSSCLGLSFSMPPVRTAHGRLPEWPKGAVCKTVGSAYVGSNPTPATTCENGPRAAETRPGGPFPSRHAMYQRVSLWVDVAQWLRTYGVQRTAGRSGAYNRSLCRSTPVLSHYPGAGTARLTDVPDIPAGQFGSSPSCSRWAAGWPCSCLRPGRVAGSARTIPSRLLLRRWPRARRCRWDGRPA